MSTANVLLLLLVDVPLRAGALQLHKIPEDMLQRYVDELSALANAEGITSNHKRYMQRRLDYTLAGLEFRRAADALNEETKKPCECPECLKKAAPHG